MAKKNIKLYGGGTLLGASSPSSAVGKSITFGIGDISKIISQSNTSLGLVAFGYDETNGTGAIAVGGLLVTSKVLNITSNKGETTDASQITISFLGAEPLTIDIISRADAVALIGELVETLTDQISDAVTSANEANDKVADVSNRLYDVSTRVDNVSTKLENVSTKLENVSTKLEDVSTEVDGFNSTLSDLIVGLSAELANFITDVSADKPINAAKVGLTLNVSLNVDNDTVYVSNNMLKANAYNLSVKSAPNDGFLKTYQLLKTSGTGTNTVVGEIDIPKDQVLEEVHLCKATKSGNTYTETAKQSDPDYDTAEGVVCLHFKWHTVGDTTSISDTFIEVSELGADYVGSTYINVNNHVISLNDVSVKADLVPDYLGSKYISVIEDINSHDYVIGLYTASVKADLVDPSVSPLYAKLTSVDTSLNNHDTSINDLVNALRDVNSSIGNIKDEAIDDVSIKSNVKTILVRGSYNVDGTSYTYTTINNGVTLFNISQKELNDTTYTTLLDWESTEYKEKLLNQNYAISVNLILTLDASNILSLTNRTVTLENNMVWYQL